VYGRHRELGSIAIMDCTLAA